MRIGLATIALVAALGAVRPALAAPVTWEFAGVIDATQTSLALDLASLFPVGGTVRWTWTFETDWPQMMSTADRAVYRFDGGLPDSQFSWSGLVAGHQYSEGAGPTHVSVLRDGHLVFDTSLSGTAVTGDMAGPWRPVAFDVGLTWPAPLGSLSLPSSPAPGGQFRLSLSPFAGASEAGAVIGSFTAVRSVPEPSTLLTLMVGAAAAGAVRRRRRGPPRA